MIEDLDPPSFDFGRDREERDRPREREPGFLPDPDDLLDFDEPVEENAPEPPPPARSRFQRLVPEMSETTARVVVAVPWIVFAIAIVGIGGTSSRLRWSASESSASVSSSGCRPRSARSCCPGTRRSRGW